MITPRTVLAGLLLTLTLPACGRPFDVNTPDGFVELHEQAPDYDYRATTPDGVVVAVRAIDAEDRTDVMFWERAILLRVRKQPGYELLGADDVRSADGTAGRRLRFGHTLNGKAHRYTVSVFAVQDRVFVLEAGGEADAVRRLEPRLAAQVASFRARCGVPGAPVVASRTCNRW
jgi:hypothetical protein